MRVGVMEGAYVGNDVAPCSTAELESNATATDKKRSQGDI
jgi:hypothetical protein